MKILYEFGKALSFSTLSSVYLVATILSIRQLCVYFLGEKLFNENREIIALLGALITFGSYALIIFYCFNRQEKIDEKFIESCENGDMCAIRKILNAKYIDRADIHADNDKGLRLACANGHLELVKYLLTSPDLKEHADIHADDDEGFKFACDNWHIKVVYFYIFDMNFQLSIVTKGWINLMDNKDEILILFDKRDFERQLQNNLKVKIQDEKPVKRAKI